MCGLIGVYGHEYVAQDAYDAMVTLQHRGQDAAGLVTYDGAFHVRKDFGLVKDVFQNRHMRKLQGHAAIGHTRYATIGQGDSGELQPFVGPAPFGVALAHNGNLFNSTELRKEIYEKDKRLVNSESDGEVLLNLFTKALTKQDPDPLIPKHIWKAIDSVYKRAKGGFSVVAYIGGQGMVAFRDPKGIRPLLMGKRESGFVTDYMFASESITFDILGFECIGDIAAGEAVFIDEKTRTLHRSQIRDETPTPCAFEFVYFARPDSVLDGISVYQARLSMGQKLARHIKKKKLPIDVVMPVPDSGRAASFAVADELSVPYREGLVRNRDIGRTFIMPGQKLRKKSIRYKLNPIHSEIKGKNILLIDDSIVRGNTSRQIIEMVRAAGANKVYFASYSPPVMSPNVYGIDIPTRSELIAATMPIEEIEKNLGCDALFYGTIADMFSACTEESDTITDLDMSCFDGVYKTGDVTEEILKRQEQARIAERMNMPMNEEEKAVGQLNLL